MVTYYFGNWGPGVRLNYGNLWFGIKPEIGVVNFTGELFLGTSFFRNVVFAGAAEASRLVSLMFWSRVVG